jgi:hypothetical protein
MQRHRTPIQILILMQKQMLMQILNKNRIQILIQLLSHMEAGILK